MENMVKRMNLIKNNKMNETELFQMLGKTFEGEVLVCPDNCEYCKRAILFIWDSGNFNNYWPYPGTSAIRSSVFKYSEVIEQMRKLDLKDKNLINTIGNTHARIHCSPSDDSLRFSNESIRLLCNKCFRKTYNRYTIKVGESMYALSIVESRRETIDSVAKEFGFLDYEVIGKGAIEDYV